MNNLLIFSDLHLCQSSIKECRNILAEIMVLVEENKIDTVIDLGDTFDQLYPKSEELDLFSEFIARTDARFIILAADSHESIDKKNSIVNHFALLSDKVAVVKEFKDDDEMYCGHFILQESKKNFGGTISVDSLKKYNKVFLGHAHSFDEKDNWMQIGSCRWVSFAEAQDVKKYVIIVENYGSEFEQIRRIPLKTPYPMIEVVFSKKVPEIASNEPKKGYFNTLSKLKGCLDKLKPETKVKIKVKDFESLKEILSIEEYYRGKFNVFIRENDFAVTEIVENKKEQVDLKSSLMEFLEKNKVDKEIKDVLLKEIK